MMPPCVEHLPQRLAGETTTLAYSHELIWGLSEKILDWECLSPTNEGTLQRVLEHTHLCDNTESEAGSIALERHCPGVPWEALERHVGQSTP